MVPLVGAVALVALVALLGRLLAMLALALASASAGAQPAQAAQAARLAAAGTPDTPGFGVMVHFLPGKQEMADIAHFDVEAFATALAQMRATHLILTLGQNSGQFIAPNAALEALCPNSARNRPPRDLPMEIGRALRSRGISMILYLPFRAPQADPYLMDCLGDDNEQLPPSARFIANWSVVIKDWADQYGPLATGWWFDGVYNTMGMSASDWGALCDAARSGAPRRWLAFNRGEGPERFSLKSAPCQNLMAGEFMAPPTLPAHFTAPPSELVFHVMTPLGTSWGRPSPSRFSAAQLRTWIADAAARGGMFTLDVPLDDNSHFLPAQIALVRSATAPKP